MRKIKKGDTVKLMRGKDAGNTGEVLMVLSKKNKKGIEVTQVVVKGLNKVKKSVKPNAQLGIEGGIIEFEKPVDISNVMYYDADAKSVSRVGFKVDEKTGKKVRFSKKSGKVIN